MNRADPRVYQLGRKSKTFTFFSFVYCFLEALIFKL